MGGNNYELDLETEIAKWRSSRASVHSNKFVVRCGVIEMQMEGLAWSVEARPLPNSTDYTFTNIELKQSKSPLHLQPKLKLLVVALQTYIRSVFSVEKLLDKLYACSCFFSRPQTVMWWWIIVDAEIMAAACKTATEATQEAAEATANFLVELMEPRACFPRQNIITEEVWAASFSATEIWNGVAQAAVNGGNVLQWCKVEVLEMERPFPCFEFEVAVQDFLQVNDEISKIGLVNSCALKVRVQLEEEIRVVCSQEGVETQTSLGLTSLLPQLIKNYITSAPERNEGEDGVKNIVEGLLQRVVGYLTFLPRVCIVCGSHRLLSCSRSSCSTIWGARKDICRDSLPRSTWATDDLLRREGNARNSLSNTEAAEQGLSTLRLRDDVEDDVEALKRRKLL